MTRVLTYGTFDLLHIGHINLLKRARELGDELIVGVSTDEFNNLKGKFATYNYDERKTIVESLRFVDIVIPENSWEQKIDDIKKYNIDIFVMGDDWKGKFDELNKYCNIVYLPRTENISTSETKLSIKNNSN